MIIDLSWTMTTISSYNHQHATLNSTPNYTKKHHEKFHKTQQK